MVVVVGSAGGVGAATVAVVSNPGPGLPGDVVGVTSLTDTLIGPKSFLDGSLRNPLTNQFSSLCQTFINHLTLLPRSDILFTDRTDKIIGRNNLIKSNSFYHLSVIFFFFAACRGLLNKLRMFMQIYKFIILYKDSYELSKKVK